MRETSRLAIVMRSLEKALAVMLVGIATYGCDPSGRVTAPGRTLPREADRCFPEANRAGSPLLAVLSATPADSIPGFDTAVEASASPSAREVPTAPVDSGPFIECITDLDPTAPGYYIGFTDKECLNPGGIDDLDQDVFVDNCERALAAKFAPILLVDPWECDATMWDGSPPFSARLGGEYYYVAARRPHAPEGIYLVYLPAWYRDCTGAFSHAGDTEFVGVRVWFNRESMHWVASGYLLSVHCLAFPPADAYCVWRYPPDYGDVLTERPGGAPWVVVTSSKHAQYAFYNECTWFGDDCGLSTYEMRFPVNYVWQNAGSRNAQLPWSESNCPRAKGSGPYIGPDQRECIWANSTGFRGWQTSVVPGEATPYGRLLNAFFGL